LKNLLTQITGLPWTYAIHADPQQSHIMAKERLVANLESCAAMSPEEAKANWSYITHAANVLPQLLDSAKAIQRLAPYGPHLSPDINRALASLRAAIERANRVSN